MVWRNSNLKLTWMTKWWLITMKQPATSQLSAAGHLLDLIICFEFHSESLTLNIIIYNSVPQFYCIVFSMLKIIIQTSQLNKAILGSHLLKRWLLTRLLIFVKIWHNFLQQYFRFIRDTNKNKNVTRIEEKILQAVPLSHIFGK